VNVPSRVEMQHIFGTNTSTVIEHSSISYGSDQEQYD
jgi:hypothetical protein